jgi:hypothetical protein
MNEANGITELESALVELSNILEDAEEFSLLFDKKIRLLENRNDVVSNGKGGSLVQNGGYIPRLYELIEGLREVNRKNTDSMNYLNKLI